MQARRNDPNRFSFDQLVESYQQELSDFARSRVARAEDAEDLLQDVWLQYGRAMDQSVIDQPRAWLYRALRNRIIDQYRRKAPDWLEEQLLEEGFEEPWSDDDATEEALNEATFWELFYEALDSLPEKQRTVFLLNELEGLTLREIADASGESLKTIISRKGYAVRRLRQLLLVEEID